MKYQLYLKPENGTDFTVITMDGADAAAKAVAGFVGLDFTVSVSNETHDHLSAIGQTALYKALLEVNA